jgi:hypothetical protein
LFAAAGQAVSYLELKDMGPPEPSARYEPSASSFVAATAGQCSVDCVELAQKYFFKLTSKSFCVLV